ncbi:MAG: proton-conducting transporter membrane subunit [bacterium]
MIFPAGLILFFLIFGLAVFPKRWLKGYAVLIMTGLVVYHWFLVSGGQFGFEFIGFNLRLFQYREYSRLVGLIFSLFALAYYIYIWSHNRSRFFYLFSLANVAAGLSILFVKDFVSFYIFWEILTVTVVILIFIDSSSTELGTKYFIYQFIGTVSLLTGIAICYSQTGSVELAAVPLSYPFFIVAVFVKAAIVPFHLWLVDTYPYVSFDLAVFLSAFVTKVGVFSVYILTPLVNLEIAGGLLACVAVLYAIKQTQLRNFLSYHIISQIGYMLAGLSSATALGAIGGTYHLISHVLYKGLLFMVAAVITLELGSEKIRGQGGFNLTRRRPLLFVAALIGSASITGLPPFNGFVSKTILVAGLESQLARYLLIAASIGTGFSFTKFIYFCFLKPGGKKVLSENCLVLSEKSALFFLSGLCLLMGIVPDFFLAGTPAAGMRFYSLFSVLKGLLPGLVAVFLFITGYKIIIFAIEFVFPAWGKINLLPSAAIKKILAALQQLHNGNLQRYMSWVFSILLFLWLYLFNYESWFTPLFKITKNQLLFFLRVTGG